MPPPDGTTCKRCKMHVNLSRKPVTRNNVHRSRKNCDGGCWGQESVTLIRLWCETHELRAEDTKKTFGTYSAGRPRAAPTRIRMWCRPRRWNRLLRVGASCANTARRGRGESAPRMTQKSSRPSRRSGGTSRPSLGVGTCHRTTGGSAPNARVFFVWDFTEARSGGTGASATRAPKD